MASADVHFADNLFVRLALGQFQMQDALLHFGLDVFCVDVFDVEAAGHRAAAPLAAQILVLLDIFLFVHVDRNGQDVVVNFDVDLLPVDAWEFGLQQLSLVILADVDPHKAAAVVKRRKDRIIKEIFK